MGDGGLPLDSDSDDADGGSTGSLHDSDGGSSYVYGCCGGFVEEVNISKMLTVLAVRKG